MNAYSQRKVVKAIEVVRCLREGMSDADMMNRFGLSTKRLEWILDQLEARGLVTRPELDARLARSKVWDHIEIAPVIEASKKKPSKTTKPVIDAADAIRSIRSGMTDEELMNRYMITAKGVQSLQRKLLAANLIMPEDLESRKGQDELSVDLDEIAGEDPAFNSDQPPLEAAELLQDLRSGAGCVQLIETYKISTLRLRTLLDDLVGRNLISRSELHCVFPPLSETFEIKDRFTNEIIFAGEASTREELVEQAVMTRVNLTNAGLAGIGLARADLSGARLVGANLTRANLVGANLTGARLRDARLNSADMYGANLFKANLGGADCSEANMSNISAAWVFLANANLSEANLSGANLSGANLAGANLFEAILVGANLRGAYLEGANIEAARNR